MYIHVGNFCCSTWVNHVCYGLFAKAAVKVWVGYVHVEMILCVDAIGYDYVLADCSELRAPNRRQQMPVDLLRVLWGFNRDFCRFLVGIMAHLYIGKTRLTKSPPVDGETDIRQRKSFTHLLGKKWLDGG